VLEGIAGDVKGRTFFVGQRTVTLGRGQTNFIQTTDDEASRIHCHIKPQGEGLLVSDMSSKNGFKINQALVSGKGLLRDGDVLAVGKATFVFHRTKRVETDASLERKRVGKFVAKSTVQGGADLLNKSD